MISDRMASILISVVTIIWAANIIAGMVAWRGYHPDQAINGIFMVIVGGAFALRYKSGANGHSDGDGGHRK